MNKSLLLLLSVMAWLCVVLVQAQDETQRGLKLVRVSPMGEKVTGRQFLLTIGINDYLNWPKLNTAVNDAKEMKEVLQKNYFFRPEHIIELYDSEATRKNILEKLVWLAKNMKQEDSLLIFYAGHGQMDELTKKGSWIPIESDTSNPDAWLKNQDIKDYLGACKARHILLVSDSCFAGDFFRGGREKLPEITDDYVKKAYDLAARQAITSGGLEPVSDAGREGHSVFSYFLLDALRNNRRSFLIPSDIFGKVAAGVAHNAKQNPQIGHLTDTGGQGGEYVFFWTPGSKEEFAAREEELKRQAEDVKKREKEQQAEQDKLLVQEKEAKARIEKLEQQIAEAKKKLGLSTRKDQKKLDEMLAMVKQKQETKKQLLALEEERKRKEQERIAELARLKAERLANAKAMLQTAVGKYQEIVNSEEGAELKEQAWQALVGEAPDWWQAGKVTPYDIESLMLPEEERTNFQISLATMDAEQRKRSDFWTGEKMTVQVSWKVIQVLPKASGKIEVYNGKTRLCEKSVAAPIQAGIERFPFALDLPAGNHTLTAQVSIGTLVRQKEQAVQVRKTPGLTLQGPGSTAEKGDRVTYRLTVKNEASESLSELAVQVVLPEQVKYKGQEMGGKKLTWKLPPLKAGATSEVIWYEIEYMENGSSTTTAQLLIAGNLVVTKTASVTVNEERRLAREAEERRLAEIRRKQEEEAEAAKWAEVSSDGRYKKSRAGVILDTKTNLEWFVGPDQDTTWDAAKSWTDGLTVDGGGWRMPTIEELRGLYQSGKGSRNMEPLFVTNSWYIWSCDDVTSSSARGVNFGSGYDGSYDRYDSDGTRGFCVRARRNG
jgi:uncharacterized caspase-like protein